VVLVVVAGAATVADRAASAGIAVRLVPVAVMLLAGLAALLGLLHLLGSRVVRPTTRDGASSGTRPEGTPPEGRDFDRRRFLAAAAAVSAAAAGGGLASRAIGGAAASDRAALELPAASDGAGPIPRGTVLDVDGITPYVTPNADFYRVDTALQVPKVPLDTWSLRIHGMVDSDIELTFEDLLAMPLVERRVTMTCVSNPVGGELVGTATWLGVRTKDLLAMAGVQAGADAVKSTSADDMTIGTPLEALTDDREALIVVGMNGEPLPLDHGFPVRMITPGLYGYVGATKWLVDLEVTRFADFEAYWTPRGYAEEAPIKLSARIDVPRSFARVRRGPVTVAGVAWAQPTGVARVEVRVDHGDWEVAELGTADTPHTWRQWRHTWDAGEPGGHTLVVRCTDTDGNVQVEERAPVAPDGSSGWHSVRVTVED
ncbi:molybdopterin-dependent oxidoreductase, partial [Nocardioides massiliensis]